MTDLLDPSNPGLDREPADPDVASDEGRVTEIGEPEAVDRSDHTYATVLGIVGLLVVVIVGLAGLGTLMSTDDAGRDVPEIVVPRVAGRTLPQAQEQLEQLGLIVDVRYEPNETVPIDIVVDQEPVAGARLEVGEQVVVVVSDGPAGVRIPKLGDVAPAEAVRLLAALGLSPVVADVYDEEVPQGQIIGSVPAAGARAQPGQQVTVQVSQGPEPRTVPEMVGTPSAEAFVALGRAELQVGKVTRRVESGATPGTVLSTSPAAGEQAPRGYPVDVVIAAEPGVITVPDLVGFTQASARRIASELGLSTTVRTEVVQPGDRREGRVLSQAPVAGSPTNGGSSVTITVGTVPAPTTTTTTTPDGSTTTTQPG